MSKRFLLTVLPLLALISGCAHGPRAASGGPEMEIRLRNVTKQIEGMWVVRLEYYWLGEKPLPGNISTHQSTSGFTQENRVYPGRPSGILNVNHLSTENLMAKMGQEGQILFRDVPLDAAGVSGSRVRFFVQRDGKRISNVLTFELP